MNALLERSGIVFGNGHSWSLVNLEGKYYYIDPTYLDYTYDKWSHCPTEKARMFRVKKKRMYLADPVVVERRENKDPYEKEYYYADAPFWLNAYDELTNSKENINGKTF